MKNEIKVGTKLIAIGECKMISGEGNALKIGKEYTVKDIRVCPVDKTLDMAIESELYDEHYFVLDNIHEYFKLAEPTYTLTADELKEIAEEEAKIIVAEKYGTTPEQIKINK